jgi:DNA polymerase-1
MIIIFFVMLCYAKDTSFIILGNPFDCQLYGFPYTPATMKPEKITIIDGSGYIFRAFFAIQRLSNSKGFPTNAVFGFINMLLKVLEAEKPFKLVMTFDTAKPSFRKDMYQDYKSNRSVPPDDLITQIPYIYRAVDAFGIRRLYAEGFEADDVIGTLAKRAAADGFLVEIITGDKDLMQLVDDNITLYDTMKDKRTDRAGVFERFGVNPDQIVDLLGLMGDSSDNIPGVTGIGEKTAAELIKTFGSMEKIYEGIDQIKQQKRRDTLVAEKETAFLSRDLATVNCEVPLDFDFNWQTLNYEGPQPELISLLEELEFQNLIKRLDLKPTEKKIESVPVETHYVAVKTEEALVAMVHELETKKEISVDTETTSLNIQEAKLVGISLCGTAGTAYYVPVGHTLGGELNLLERQLAPEIVRKTLKPLLENLKIKKVGQNLKYDLQILKRWGIELANIASDTMLASYLLDPEQSHNLDSLALRHLGHTNISYDEMTGTGRTRISFAEVAIDRATAYSGEDADITLKLHEKLVPELKKVNLYDLYERVEVPLLKILADMEYGGIKVDRERLQIISDNLSIEIGDVEKRIYFIAQGEFNINSPKQLSALLFEKLKLPVIKKTKTGNSTDESVLIQLASEHEICAWIVRYRELAKLKSTYAEGLLTQISAETGRLHTSYNQTVTATGRLSSSNPNLQNIPAGADAKYDIRSVFIPSPGCQLLSADYSQVELRLLADMSGDPELMRAFLNNEDVHDFTGRLIFGVPEISPEQRKIAKTINFGVIYGQTPFGLSRGLRISPKEAKVFIDTYFARYAGIQTFLNHLKQEATACGYAVTRLGRRRYLPELKSSNRMRREVAERAAINAPIQGTAADMIKVAMVSLHKRLHSQDLSARMLLQVHDELVLEVPENERDIVEKVVREEMENALVLKVPLKVDMGWGNNWRECS